MLIVLVLSCVAQVSTPRVGLRLHSILGSWAKETDAAPLTHAVVRIDFGPDAESHMERPSLLRYSTWTSGRPLLQRSSDTGDDSISLAFFSKRHTVLDLGAKTPEEQSAFHVNIRLEGLDGKEIASGEKGVRPIYAGAGLVYLRISRGHKRGSSHRSLFHLFCFVLLPHPAPCGACLKSCTAKSPRLASSTTRSLLYLCGVDNISYIQ